MRLSIYLFKYIYSWEHKRTENRRKVGAVSPHRVCFKVENWREFLRALYVTYRKYNGPKLHDNKKRQHKTRLLFWQTPPFLSYIWKVFWNNNNIIILYGLCEKGGRKGRVVQKRKSRYFIDSVILIVCKDSPFGGEATVESSFSKVLNLETKRTWKWCKINS